jgi:hypothetical protein
MDLAERGARLVCFAVIDRKGRSVAPARQTQCDALVVKPGERVSIECARQADGGAQCIGPCIEPAQACLPGIHPRQEREALLRMRSERDRPLAVRPRHSVQHP